jgi:F-type H+-transporting ATPase subunit delta
MAVKMLNNELFNHYAIGLFDLAKEDDTVEATRKDVKIVRNLLKDYPKFVSILSDVDISKEERYAIVDEVFALLSLDVKAFIKVIIRNDRATSIYKIFREALYRFDDALGIEEGKLYSSKRMDEVDIERIAEAISKNTGRRIELNQYIDPDLLGGFKIVLENDVYDASLLHSIEQLKAKLLGGN